MIGEQRRAAHVPVGVEPRSRPVDQLQTTDEDLVDPCQRLGEARKAERAHVEVSADHCRVAPRHEPLDLLEFTTGDVRPVRRVDVRDEQVAARVPEPGDLAHPALGACVRVEPLDAELHDLEAPRDQHRIRLTGEGRSNVPGIEVMQHSGERSEQRALRHRPAGLHPAPLRELPERPHRDLLQTHDIGRIGHDQAHHSLDVQAPGFGEASAVKEVPRPDEELVAHASPYSRPVRVLLLDPAAYTLPYDHHLAGALAARGAEVELVASRFRFGDAPEPHGYHRRELFYPLSTRLFRRSRLRLPLKAAEHAVGLVRVRSIRRDVLHVQWAPLPQVDSRLLPVDGPAVITAHDVLPRRTAGRPDLWRTLYGRFDRVVVHSERGRARLTDEVGVRSDRTVVIPHPVFPGTFRYESAEPTLLFLGVIQPYKQLDHALEVAATLGMRLLVVGDPTYDLGDRLSRSGVEWRLGYRPEAEIDDALAEATVAVFPYREELDQSGALLRALGAGVPVAAYDVGGIAEPVRRYGAGVVAPADDLQALAAGVNRLRDDPAALDAARAGARRAAAELTWDAAAQAHLALYEEILFR